MVGGITAVLAGATVFTATPSHAATQSAQAARATQAAQAKTITWAIAPGAGPNWILPVVPAASNSVYNVYSFELNMWRPLYWPDRGVSAAIDPTLSLARPPAWSNAGTTATITMNPRYR